MTDTDEYLRRVPLFSGMTDRAITAIAALVVEQQFDTGAALTVEGEPGEAFFIIADGTADLTRNSRSIRTMGPGDFVGEISLVDGGPRTATVTALTPLRALVIRRPEFLALMDGFASVRLGILSAMTERIRANQRADEA